MLKTNEQKVFQIIGHIVMIIVSLMCILPIILLFIASVTSEEWIVFNGYSFFPGELSTAAYDYMFDQGNQILNAYVITIVVTIIGTVLNVMLTALTAYPLSKIDLPFGKAINYFVFFTMLFNGGLVPTYMMYVNTFGIRDSIWALLLPSNLLLSAWYIMIMRTYMKGNIPNAILESAEIDGAGEFKVFLSMVLPMSKPMIATVALFAGIGYWNDWYNGMIYVSDQAYFSVQNLLTRMLLDIQYMSNSPSAAAVGASLPSASARMAIAAIGLIPIIIIYPFLQKNFVKGIAVGAVKG